jgi:hypothetical protein
VLGEGEAATEEGRRLAAAFGAYFDARVRFRLDPEARSAKHTHWREAAGGSELGLAQVLVDPEERNDWEVSFILSLPESRAANRPVLRFESLLPVGTYESAAGEAGEAGAVDPAPAPTTP